MNYIATFYSHFGAIRFMRLCRDAGFPATLMPVPRNLSSSCGTCVRYTGDRMCPAGEIPGETEQIVRETQDGYVNLFRAEDS